jgi:hypothetical protein
MSESAILVEGSETRAYASLASAPSAEILREHGIQTLRRGEALAVVARSVTNSLNLNRIIGLGIGEPATTEALDALVQPFVQQGLSFALELSPQARPAELPEWLRARGMRKAMASAMLWRKAEPLAAPPTALDITRAAPADARCVADICCDVFKMPAAAHEMIMAAARLPQWRLWLGLLEGRPVAAALSFVQDGVAWLGWDATLPHARGSGAHSAFIAHRVSDAAASGCAYATCETAVASRGVEDASLRNYRRAGFTVAYERGTYVAVRRAGAPVRAAAGALQGAA